MCGSVYDNPVTWMVFDFVTNPTLAPLSSDIMRLSFTHIVTGMKLFANWINLDWRDESVDYKDLVFLFFLWLLWKHLEVWRHVFWIVLSDVIKWKTTEWLMALKWCLAAEITLMRGRCCSVCVFEGRRQFWHQVCTKSVKQVACLGDKSTWEAGRDSWLMGKTVLGVEHSR